MRALLEASGRPLAAPSANASGSISPTRAEHVAASLDGRIPLILDDGPTSQGIESTIVREVFGMTRILRASPRRSNRPASCSRITPRASRSGSTRRAPPRTNG
jgi:L-threonylcarbamoyladenylate synthase